MFHSNTQQMIDYWRGKGGLAGVPVRAAIDPTEFPRIAPQALMLGRAASGVYPVRLSGGLVADLHGRDLRGANFLSLFAEPDRAELHRAMETARRRPEPIVVAATGYADEGSVDLEILLAPVAAAPGSPERFLGFYQPLTLVSRLNDSALRELRLHEVRSVGAANEEPHRLRLATLDGRRVA